MRPRGAPMKRFHSLLWVLALAASAVVAQIVSGSISGTVKDPAGLAISGPPSRRCIWPPAGNARHSLTSRETLSSAVWRPASII